MEFFKNMNLPNRLTCLRVVMIPFFVLFLMLSDKAVVFKVLALIIFCAACITDTLDGYIARSRNLVTTFGKFMDPLADKLLVCSALICFTSLGRLSAWVVIVIVAREFIISGFRLVASNKGVVIAAGKTGKLKTIFQMLTCILLIFNQPHIKWLTVIFVLITVALTIISLVEYISKNKEVLTD